MRLLAEILLRESARWGVKVSRRGDSLTLAPAGRCPAELRDLLRQHKPEILDLLQAKAEGLPPDCAPWLHISKQISAGEFDNCDSSMRESLAIGLRSISHPLCRAAFEKLQLQAAREKL